MFGRATIRLGPHSSYIYSVLSGLANSLCKFYGALMKIYKWRFAFEWHCIGQNLVFSRPVLNGYLFDSLPSVL